MQDKLRAELLEIMPTKDSFSYDQIMDLEYLDQVWNGNEKNLLHGIHLKIESKQIQNLLIYILESLRLHPPAVWLSKMCHEEVNVEWKNKKMSFKKGDVFYIPLMSIQVDPEYYENPLTFNPERFDPENGGAKAYKEKGNKRFFSFFFPISKLFILFRCILSLW